ncbi:MAG: Asp-tRNA(Asn)/Glu-tRNA(Gln) amidotransferase subunit GatA [Planctomycetes bacterium]|nr:Asp-tRNA(Asn)/Glu-tRNA(Gln) amidotransferase subunit GatA [Planctomycetota bacterium]
MPDLLSLDATELAARIAAGAVTAEAATQAALDRAKATEARVGAYLLLDEAGALAAAREIDAARRAGKSPGPLAGVPVAIKDNIHVAGKPTTCASRMLQGFVAGYDATVTARLKAAGAVILGKTNLDEFAMGSSCENSALKQTRNPWDVSRVPGGSSGGSAAAVAARSAYLSLGSDTGGSIRLPASFTGLVGYKPGYGRVSRYGLVAFASSLDQIGPFARSVRDVALSLKVMAGRDAMDSTSHPAPVPDYPALLGNDLKGKRVGVVREYLDKLPNREVAGMCESAIARMKALGAEIVEITLPHADYGVQVYYVVASAEASSNLARFDGVRYGLRVPADNGIATYVATRGGGFGPEVKRRIMLGTFALSAGAYDEFYGRAARVRTLICRDFEQAFARCDLIATPCAPFPAFKAGEISDPLSMYLCDIYTSPASLAGLCALSLPVGFDSAGLPIGMHLSAPAYHDERLLSAAHALEQNLRADAALNLNRAPAV